MVRVQAKGNKREQRQTLPWDHQADNSLSADPLAGLADNSRLFAYLEAQGESNKATMSDSEFASTDQDSQGTGAEGAG